MCQRITVCTISDARLIVVSKYKVHVTIVVSKYLVSVTLPIGVILDEQLLLMMAIVMPQNVCLIENN